jgi:hypothetical protein
MFSFVGYKRCPIYCPNHNANMLITVTYCGGKFMVVIEFVDGARYRGEFWFDENLNYLGAIETLNPP